MPNENPLWFLTKESKIPDDLLKEKKDPLFNTDNLLAGNAPPEVVALAQNIAEILSNIRERRGENYSLVTCALLTAAQNAMQLEATACENIPYSNPAHTYSHIFGSAILDSLNKLVSLLESPGNHYNGLRTDLDTLTKRIWDDYHSHHSPQSPSKDGEPDA